MVKSVYDYINILVKGNITVENTAVTGKYINIKWYIYVVFTTDEFFEVAIESWSEWDLNPQTLSSVQKL